MAFITLDDTITTNSKTASKVIPKLNDNVTVNISANESRIFDTRVPSRVVTVAIFFGVRLKTTPPRFITNKGSLRKFIVLTDTLRKQALVEDYH